jgi:hypothetical protein
MKRSATYAETRELTSEQYHAEREHDSNTTLRLFEKSPLEYYHVRVSGERKLDTTKPMRLGTLAHICIIEPEKIPELVRVIPAEVLGKNESRSTNAYKAWAEEHASFTTCLQRELDEALWQARNVHQNSEVVRLLKRVTLREQSIFWSDGESRTKCRLDFGCEFDAEIVDVKRTTSINEFWKAVRTYGYEKQAALYCDGYHARYGEMPAYRFLLVSDNLCDSCVRTMPPEAVDLGRKANIDTLRKLNECRAGLRPWIKEGYDETRLLEIPQHFYPVEPGTYQGI